MRPLIAAALLCVLMTPAAANPEWPVQITEAVQKAPERPRAGRGAPARRVVRDARPKRWCGWYMRQRRDVADKRFNLARHWLHYGRPTSPKPGAVVVWRGHVGELVRQVRGNIWEVHSGNDSNAVRTRPRSIAGAIGFRAL